MDSNYIAFFCFGLLVGLSIHAYNLRRIIKRIEKAEEKMQTILCDKCKKLEVTID